MQYTLVEKAGTEGEAELSHLEAVS